MSLYGRFVTSVLFPVHERIKGHDTVSLRRELEETQWWPHDQLQALQLERLQKLLGTVSRSVPFYRDLFRDLNLTVASFGSLSDLSLLPVVDKALIRSEGDQWLMQGARRLIMQRTSGSSGEPLRFWLSQHRVSMDIAAKWRATRWWDVDLGDRELVLWGSSIETGAQNRARRWRDSLFRSRLVPARDLDEAKLDLILDEICSYRPRMLFGYPSVLARVSWQARNRGILMDDLGIRVAFATSEVLRPEWRAVIGETFGCGVANEYGARDAGFIARECPSGGLHISAEALIVEVIDESGASLPPGEVGDIVVTNLSGPEFPFIRYRTGDRGSLDTTPCGCGRGLPRLREVLGRANDGLLALNGAWIHGSAFNYLLRELDGLRAYKIVQDSREQIEVMLALDGDPPADFVRQLDNAFHERLGAGVAVRLTRVDSIAPEPNGKYRHVVCRVDSDQGQSKGRGVKR